MRYFDAVVIGGGILGCMTARELRRWDITTLLLEKEADVCTGITRANSAIVYPGYDNKPGSLKAELTVRGNAGMEQLCRELDVPFSRCGSLLVTYDAEAVPRLEKKMKNGSRNGVPGLRLLTGPEAEAMEPMLRGGVVAAVYAPTTGTVDPWALGIAACENAVHNGAQLRLDTAVTGIRKTGEGYAVETEGETFLCKTVFNCAGLFADKVHDLLCTSPVRLELDGAEYLVMDRLAKKPGKVIFLQAESCGKGITAIPCPGGELLISGVRKPLEIPFGTSPEGLRELRDATLELLPEAEPDMVIRSFGAVRPNPQRETGESIHDYCIEESAPGFYSLIGIKTPGLTCAQGLGALLAGKAAAFLHAEPNAAFDPIRPGIREEDDEILCQCRQISRAQILEAIRRGARSVEAVKRRAGTGMGPCQGSRCTYAIEKLLEEHGHGAL